MVIRDDAANTITIHCNECRVAAPPPEVIMAGHGLNNMGWYCWGGNHICPEHPHPERVPMCAIPIPASGSRATG